MTSLGFGLSGTKCGYVCAIFPANDFVLNPLKQWKEFQFTGKLIRFQLKQLASMGILFAMPRQIPIE